MSTKMTTSSVCEDEMMQDQQIEEAQAVAAERSALRMNRRRLITNLSMAAGAAGALGIAGCSNDGTVTVPTTTSSTPSVTDVLNFALNLEYFEATFYAYIATGNGLPSSMLGSNPGTVTGGAKVAFQYSAIQNIANNLATEEMEHVQFLIQTIQQLGGTPVSLPALYLAAMGTVNSDATFVAMSRTIETVGVSAYAGAAGYLASNTTAITYAASILDVEAQHESALRQSCIYFPTGAVASPAADMLDMPPTATQIFNTNNSTGLVTARTPQQVLGIVYGVTTASTSTTPASGTVKGGFFPNGFNGNVFST